jgi:hypothetical protein
MKFDPSKELSERELKDLLACIQGSDGTLIISKHAKERMLERRYSLRDVLHIIAHGTMTGSEFNQAPANWKYTFKGEDLDGDNGGVVLAVGTHVGTQYSCVIITVLS